MSIKKKAKHCQPGDVIKVDEHKLVRYPGSENKGVCRYLVVEKVKGKGIMVYRITKKKMLVKLWSPSAKTRFGFIHNRDPILIPESLLLTIQMHRPKWEDFCHVKSLLKNKRHSRHYYNKQMCELKSKIPKLPDPLD